MSIISIDNEERKEVILSQGSVKSSDSRILIREDDYDEDSMQHLKKAEDNQKSKV